MNCRDNIIFVENSYESTQKDFTESEKVLLNRIVGSIRELDEDSESPSSVKDLKIKILSIISMRRKTVLYNAILIDKKSKFPIVVKSTIQYSEKYRDDDLMEGLMDILKNKFGAFYDYKSNQYILSNEQKSILETLRRLENIYPRLFYDDSILDSEYISHKKIWEKAVELSMEEYTCKTFGVYYDMDEPIVHYLIEKLQPLVIVNIALDISNFAIDVIRSLSVIHASGMLHLDVTPLNIMLKGDKYVVIDFGTTIKYENSTKENTEIKRYRGTPWTAARQSYHDKYSYTSDLESLVYILELFTKYELPWSFDQDDEETYYKKMKFVPTDPRSKKLWNYINEINEKSKIKNSVVQIDYDKCVSFFQENKQIEEPKEPQQNCNVM